MSQHTTKFWHYVGVLRSLAPPLLKSGSVQGRAVNGERHSTPGSPPMFRDSDHEPIANGCDRARDCDPSRLLRVRGGSKRRYKIVVATEKFVETVKVIC